MIEMSRFVRKLFSKMESFLLTPFTEKELTLLPSFIQEIFLTSSTKWDHFDRTQIFSPLDTERILVKVNPKRFKKIILELTKLASKKLKPDEKIGVVFKPTVSGIYISIKKNPQKSLTALIEMDPVNSEFIEPWGGRFQKSKSNRQGDLWLPCIPPPDSFISCISLKRGSLLFILSKDPSTHSLWKQRIKQANGFEIQIESFTEKALFESRIKQKPRFDLVLLDDQIFDEETASVDLVLRLKIAPTTLLITDRWKNVSLLEQAKRMSLKILPKALMSFIPVQMVNSNVQPKPSSSYVLIDDNEGIRALWEICARSHDIQIATFESKEAFLKEQIPDSKEVTEIYVDYYLENNTLGREVSQSLYLMGFSKVFLVTGEPKENLPPMPWLSGILGKEPPWLSLSSHDDLSTSIEP